MKKTFTQIIIICSLVFCVACSQNKSIKTPDLIGNQAFEILKTLQSSSPEQFISNFITLEETQDLANNHTLSISKDVIDQLNAMSKKDYDLVLIKSFNKLKEQAVKQGIILKEIEYLDFIYESKSSEGIDLIIGTLYFKHEGEVYQMETESVDMENDYVLSDLRNLRKK